MNSKKNRDILRYFLLAGIIILLNIIGNLKFFRLDLTSEKRFTLSDGTIELLNKVDDVLLVKIYLEGDFPAGFQRLQSETRQMLDEFRAYNPNIQYSFINPNKAETEKQSKQLKQQLQQKGIRPFQLAVNEEGGQAVTTIFPGAILNLGEQEAVVSLLQSQLGANSARQVNVSIQNLEYTLANALRSLVSDDKPLIGFLQGHEETDPRRMADFARQLSDNYRVRLFNIREFKSDTMRGEITLAEQQRRLNRFDALVIAKPKRPFNELDKYLIDQYIMNGGKTVWLLDAVRAEMDSLQVKSSFMSLPLYDRLAINDLLFKYGVRVNTNLVADLAAAGVNDQESIRPWIYFPLIMPRVDHPISKDINAVWLQFASSIDTIANPGTKKTILLRTSPYSATFAAPHIVDLNYLYSPPPKERLNKGSIPVAVLLEGEFESLYKNRLQPKGESGLLRMREKSLPTQMVVVGDGDIISNQLNVVNRNLPRGQPLPLGYDQYTGQQYGNSDFLMNTMDYMLDESDLISIRSRELKIRMLNIARLENSRWFWQTLNTAVPILGVLLFGLIYNFLRRRKYAR